MSSITPYIFWKNNNFPLISHRKPAQHIVAVKFAYCSVDLKSVLYYISRLVRQPNLPSFWSHHIFSQYAYPNMFIFLYILLSYCISIGVNQTFTFSIFHQAIQGFISFLNVNWTMVTQLKIGRTFGENSPLTFELVPLQLLAQCVSQWELNARLPIPAFRLCTDDLLSRLIKTSRI